MVSAGPLVTHYAVGRWLRMRTNVARELLSGTFKVEVFPGEKRRWFIRAADWEAVKARLQPVCASSQAQGVA